MCIRTDESDGVGVLLGAMTEKDRESLKAGPLQERLRNWLVVRLRHKKDGEEQGALSRFAEAVGWTKSQAGEYTSTEAATSRLIRSCWSWRCTI